jgi:hypothetical protein
MPADCSLKLQTAQQQTFFGAGTTFGDVLRPAVLRHQINSHVCSVI